MHSFIMLKAIPWGFDLFHFFSANTHTHTKGVFHFCKSNSNIIFDDTDHKFFIWPGLSVCEG